jgi:hypothetical protein
MQKKGEKNLAFFLYTVYCFFFDNRCRRYIAAMITSVTQKMPAIPFAMSGSVSINRSTLLISFILSQPSIVRISPPAMTEATCPETLTPTACMSRKF